MREAQERDEKAFQDALQDYQVEKDEKAQRERQKAERKRQEEAKREAEAKAAKARWQQARENHDPKGPRQATMQQDRDAMRGHGKISIPESGI